LAAGATFSFAVGCARHEDDDDRDGDDGDGDVDDDEDDLRARRENKPWRLFAEISLPSGNGKFKWPSQ
jgi:hypothetical protein